MTSNFPHTETLALRSSSPNRYALYTRLPSEKIHTLNSRSLSRTGKLRAMTPKLQNGAHRKPKLKHHDFSITKQESYKNTRLSFAGPGLSEYLDRVVLNYQNTNLNKTRLRL